MGRHARYLAAGYRPVADAVSILDSGMDEFPGQGVGAPILSNFGSTRLNHSAVAGSRRWRSKETRSETTCSGAQDKSFDAKADDRKLFRRLAMSKPRKSRARSLSIRFSLQRYHGTAGMTACAIDR